jgi:hypothetical protein
MPMMASHTFKHMTLQGTTWQPCLAPMPLAQFNLNNGRPVARNIPGTEHSVMMAWPGEREAIENMIQHFGSGAWWVPATRHAAQGRVCPECSSVPAIQACKTADSKHMPCLAALLFACPLCHACLASL